MELQATTDLATQVRERLRFWPWFAKEGLAKLCDGWLVVHAVAGLVLAAVVPDKMSEVAKIVFLPFAQVLIGLAFAWAGNAIAILQTHELQKIGTQPADPTRFRAYVFTYQMAVLILLAVLVMWGLLALGLANQWPALFSGEHRRLFGRTVAFAVSSVAIRECWHVVLGAQTMLLMRSAVQDAESKRRNERAG